MRGFSRHITSTNGCHHHPAVIDKTGVPIVLMVSSCFGGGQLYCAMGGAVSKAGLHSVSQSSIRDWLNSSTCQAWRPQKWMRHRPLWRDAHISCRINFALVMTPREAGSGGMGNPGRRRESVGGRPESPGLAVPCLPSEWHLDFRKERPKPIHSHLPGVTGKQNPYVLLL